MLGAYGGYLPATAVPKEAEACRWKAKSDCGRSWPIGAASPSSAAVTQLLSSTTPDEPAVRVGGRTGCSPSSACSAEIGWKPTQAKQTFGTDTLTSRLS